MGLHQRTVHFLGLYDLLKEVDAADVKAALIARHEAVVEEICREERPAVRCIQLYPAISSYPAISVWSLNCLTIGPRMLV